MRGVSSGGRPRGSPALFAAAARSPPRIERRSRPGCIGSAPSWGAFMVILLKVYRHLGGTAMFEIGKKGGDKGQEAASRDTGAPSAHDAPARRPASTREAAVIGPSIHIDGDLRGEEDLIIEGEVNGTVMLKNNSLTIGQQGKVSADVYAHSVYVEGYMEGDLYGSERVWIRSSAQVRGNITSPRVSLDDGARFKGTIEMDPQAVEAALGKRRGPGQQPQGGQGNTDAKGGAGFKPGNQGVKQEAVSGGKR